MSWNSLDKTTHRLLIVPMFIFCFCCYVYLYVALYAVHQCTVFSNLYVVPVYGLGIDALIG